MNKSQNFIFTLFISFTCFITAAQESESDALLQHRIRKITSDSIILAGDKMSPESFLIKLPDSIYTNSKININKFKLEGIGKMNLLIKSRDHFIYDVRYHIKGNNKAKKFLNLLLATSNTDKKNLESGTFSWRGININLRYRVNGRNHYFVFVSDLPE